MGNEAGDDKVRGGVGVIDPARWAKMLSGWPCPSICFQVWAPCSTA
jgi:hypothetical protein